MERMTRGQWVTGCLVVLGAVVGAAASSPWAERRFSPPSAVAADSKTEGEHKRTCITISGKRFEWSFPNAPFGTLSCSE
jgi:hypothetical protein